MPGKRRQEKSALQTLCKTRVTWSRLHYLKPNPDRNIGCPAAMLAQRGVIMCLPPASGGSSAQRARQVRTMRYQEIHPGCRDEWAT
jgi:hypothetical protein